MKMDRPKITIITVSYNAEKSIARTIRSVLGQTYNNYEYLIIDGGSEDRTVDVIKRYRAAFKDKGVLYRFISEKDNGIYDAMNKGISLSSEDSEWITFLNADDYYCNRNVLKNISNCMKCINAVCVYGDTIIRRENGQKYRKKASAIAHIAYKVPFVHQALFVKRDVIQRYPFDLRWSLAADYEQWLRMYLAGYVFEKLAKDIVVFDASGKSGWGYSDYLAEAIQIQKEYGLMRRYRVRRFFRINIIPWLRNSRIVYFVYALINMRKIK